ncbi:MAG: SpaA isopeptide-forming pilin-related protein [Clostridia bacterium]
MIVTKTKDGKYTDFWTDDSYFYGDCEFYLLIKKNITNVEKFNIQVKREEWWGTIYPLKYDPNINDTAGAALKSQNLIYIKASKKNKFETIDIEVNLIPPVQVELNKVDTAGAVVNGAQFKIEYDMGVKNTKGQSTETVTVKDGKITFTQAQPQSSESFQARITEVYTPTGYKQLNGEIILKFEYDEKEAKWKVTKQKEPTEKVTIGTISTNTKTGVNVIPVTVENKSIIEKLTILKTSSVGVEAVVGAKFKLTLTNVTSIKGYQLPTTAGEKTIFVTTDEKGNIVLEDIEITDLSKNVTIEIEETEAPVGYKKIDGKITVTLKREGNTYTVSETKKDNTVIDDEFQAGKVTLTNHELILNIKDIPVMNLGGIVWAEDEKTGKAPTSSDIYGDGNSEEALGGITVRLLDKNDKVIATTKTAERDNTEVKYLNNTGKESTVYLNKGQYLFTKLDDGTNYITVGTDYKVEIDYDGIKYNALMNTDARVLYTKNGKSKITSENDHGLAEGTKTISGTEIEAQSKTNGGYIIDYTLESNENTPDKAIYLKTSKDGQQAYVTAKSEKYLNKTEDWKSGWKNNNGVGEINLDNYAFDINFGLYVKRFDLNLGTDVDSATVSINGQTSTYNYDQILNGMLNDDLEKMYRTTDGEVDYNLYLAYSDYNYRIEDYKVPGTDNDSLGEPYGEKLPSDSKDESTELQVYVTYILQINNQSTQHNAIVNKVKYSYDEGYEYVESDGNVTDNNDKKELLIENIVVGPGESKEITLTFKVRKNDNGSFVKEPSDTSKYTNVAEIVEYSTTEGRLVDADSAPGNTFLGENKPTDRREDDTDTANGIVITFKKEAERSISGKVFDIDNNNTPVDDVIVQLIELVEINNKQYEYIWQETVAGSNTVKTTATSGYPGPTYNVSNEAGEYKFTERIIPGNYIVRFIYGDGRTYEIKENTLKYNGEDYKSTYVNYDYNAEWYNNTSLDGENSKAVDNEARRLKVMSYAVDVNGTKGEELALLDKNIGTNDEKLKEVLSNTWMCAETLKIKMPVDSDNKDNTSKETTVADGSKPTIENTQFKNVNFGLMERPKTKLVLEKHITGLTVKPVASGVNLIANATADISDILTGDTITLEGQQDGLIAIKSGRSNRGTWYLQTDTTELAQGADAYITYTYVIKNEGDEDYLNKDLVEFYNTANIKDYATKLSDLEVEVKNAKKKITGTSYQNGTFISEFYYTGEKGDNDNEVLATVEQIQEALNPKVKFVNSTTDFTIRKDTDGNTLVEKKNVYKQDSTEIAEEEIKEQITSTTGTRKMELNSNDTSKKLVVSVGLSASEIENGGVYDSYIAEVTHYTNAAGRRDQSTPANLAYVHSYDAGKTLENYNEEDEFWAETFRITKPTGEDKLTTVQIAIISISAVVILGVGIILIKKFVLKK